MGKLKIQRRESLRSIVLTPPLMLSQVAMQCRNCGYTVRTHKIKMESAIYQATGNRCSGCTRGGHYLSLRYKISRDPKGSIAEAEWDKFCNAYHHAWLPGMTTLADSEDEFCIAVAHVIGAGTVARRVKTINELLHLLSKREPVWRMIAMLQPISDIAQRWPRRF